ncbi:putative reticulon-4 [Triplophysa rosa]|uniref:Reticulon-4 n=1 Tax=Triplophysa rosa TaxID=992332 RepID=A0A9W7WNW8_TRIRA|nr:putative reticulon-4 [Triplophysa rosa]
MHCRNLGIHFCRPPLLLEIRLSYFLVLTLHTLLTHRPPASSAVVSQDSGANLTMDSFRQNSAEFDPDVLNQTSEDDFQFEMKNCSFHPFSAVRDAGRSVVSDSPSPDLVQDAYDGDDNVTQPQEIKALFDSDAVTSCSHLQQLDSSDLFSNVIKEADDRPTSLPDILKSSPLNPDKVDSGSSEGSPDLSPVHKSGSDSPNSQISVSANIPLGFDSKILLLKEMAEETEARAVETANLDAEKISEQSFVAFDLVKETDVPPKRERLLKDKDAETSIQMKDKFECLHFPTEKAQEHSDSESPSAESFSPVLDAVAKRPMEHENAAVREEIEAIDEVSEQEVSSEEFEFVERPPRGAADEFLEIQDSGTFYEEQSPGLEPSSARHAEDQSSYHLLSQLSDESSPVRGKTGLETAFQASLILTPADQSGLEKTEVSSLFSLKAASGKFKTDPQLSMTLFFLRTLSFSRSFHNFVFITFYSSFLHVYQLHMMPDIHLHDHFCSYIFHILV